MRYPLTLICPLERSKGRVLLTSGKRDSAVVAKGVLQAELGSRPWHSDAEQAREKCQRQCGDEGLTPAPTPEPLVALDRARSDRLAGLESAQVVGQLDRRGIAPVRVFLQALQADRLE